MVRTGAEGMKDPFPREESEEPAVSQTPDDYAYQNPTEEVWAETRSEPHRSLCRDEAWMNDSPRSELIWTAQARLQSIRRGNHSKTEWADSGPLEVRWAASTTTVVLPAIGDKATSLQASVNLGKASRAQRETLENAINAGKLQTPHATLHLEDGHLHATHRIRVKHQTRAHAALIARVAPALATHAHALTHILQTKGFLEPRTSGPQSRPGIDLKMRNHLGDTESSAEAAHRPDSRHIVIPAAAAHKFEAEPAGPGTRKEPSITIHDRASDRTSSGTRDMTGHSGKEAKTSTWLFSILSPEEAGPEEARTNLTIAIGAHIA